MAFFISHRRRTPMLNQVEFDGFLTRAWEYKEQRYMRLANHRPDEDRKIVTSHVIVQVDVRVCRTSLKIKAGDPPCTSRAWLSTNRMWTILATGEI
jgi:hypothetical protein